jgi:RimJ/RimL family protein N-acetyltransferase
MGDGDYQIGSVYTDPEFRKKGYSALIIENILQNINCPRIWYLTESHNIPSINLCKKLNFSFFNNGLRSNDKFLSFLSIYKITE